MAKTILEQFQFNLKVIKLCSKVVGADVTEPNFRINLLTWFVVGMICFYFAATFYTVYVTFVVNGEWALLLQIICVSGSGVQGASKLFSGLLHRYDIVYLLKELEAIYKHYEKKRDGYKVVLQKSVNFYSKVNQNLAALYGLVCWTLMLTPIYFYIFQHRKEFILQFLVPGIDPNTNYGFIILNCIQMCCVVFGIFGNFAGDMYFITFTTHMPMLKDILRCKFEDLNAVVENPSDASEKSMALIKDIFAWHQKYIRFMGLIKKSYFWVILIQIVSISNGIGCTLFCLLLGKWPSGFVYLLYCFIILYTYCGLGTLVEIANDGFTYSCYNDSLWYKYSLREQKMLQIMLRMCQNTPGLTVGAVYPLSISTGLQVTKTVYTFTMMLINFLD